MADASRFEILTVFPPDRDGRVVQVTAPHDAVVDIPAELYLDADETMITLFSRGDGVAWEYRLSEFLAALKAADEALNRPT